MIEFLRQPWPWYVVGPLVTLTMFLLLYFGKSFGVSSNLRTACAIMGGGKHSSFFKIDWKSEIWNLIFIGGALIGGIIGSTWLKDPNPIALNPETAARLNGFGISDVGVQFVPTGIFNWESILTPKGFIMMIIGGFLVGFGSRYAGGCTSGHAISGLSDLQLPSLLAVVGFFIGGLIMTFGILPYLLTL